MAAETVHTMATETPVHVTRLVDALSRAVSDRRRVDELVTLFEYDGVVEAAGERYSGQGAVKRFFSSLLLENGFTSMEVLTEPSSKGPDDAALRLGLTSATGTDEVALLLKFSKGLVRECHLQAAEGACSPAGCLLPSALEPSENGGGPKWETFDGRVRQKIWQRPGAFELRLTLTLALTLALALALTRVLTLARSRSRSLSFTRCLRARQPLHQGYDGAEHGASHPHRRPERVGHLRREDGGVGRVDGAEAGHGGDSGQRGPQNPRDLRPSPRRAQAC